MLDTRGDAVVAFVAERDFLQPQTLLEAIRAIHLDFGRQLELMNINTTCTCAACANVGSLDLKLFLHHGEYVEQDLGGATELQGADVILVNLLMKNTVKTTIGLDGYGLITDAAVDVMDATALVGDMHVHRQEVEHFGDLGVRIWDLRTEWDAEQTQRRTAPDPETAWVVESIDVDARPWVVWDHATDTGQKRNYCGMQLVDRIDDLGGPVTSGSQYHCVHDLGDVTLVITEWNPPDWYESDEMALGIPIHFTMEVLPRGAGLTIRILYGDPGEGDPDELEGLFRGAAREGWPAWRRSSSWASRTTTTERCGLAVSATRACRGLRPEGRKHGSSEMNARGRVGK